LPIILGLSTKIWQALAGLVSLTLVARFLSPQEQGIYFTFSSVLNLQVFFELGLGFVLLQFASHEKASLQWNESRMLDGDLLALSRLGSLVKISAKWYLAASLILFLVLTPVGTMLFVSQSAKIEGIAWLTPWLLLVIFTAGCMLINPFYSIIEGTGKISEIALLRMVQELLSALLLWWALRARLGLLSACIYQGCRFVLGSAWLLTRYGRVLWTLAGQSGKERISWSQEIFPLQWKIALSWIGGYLATQLFNPVIFAYVGPVAAGRMGMSLSVTNGMSNAVLTWISTKAALFGPLVARKDYKNLDRLFFRALKQCLILAIVAALAVFIGILILNRVTNPFIARVLSPYQWAFLLISTLGNILTSALATYLRSHKKEPLLLLSIIGGTATLVSTLVLGKFYGTTGILAGYTLIVTATSYWAARIFSRSRARWHK
jgi:O-antigen/teichoic acid export membrane protein